MQLETLITQLGLTEHMEALSDWRDALLVEKAAELQILQKEKDALNSLRLDMFEKVNVALASGDPSKFVEVATEFITPIDQKEVQAIDIKIAELQAKRDALSV